MKSLNPEKREPFEPMAERDALRFLHTELASLENTIRERSVYLAETYPSGRLPPGEIDLSEVFEEEKALIMKLVGDCQKKPLTEAFYQQMDEERRRVLQLITKETCEPAEAGSQSGSDTFGHAGPMARLAEGYHSARCLGYRTLSR